LALRFETSVTYEKFHGSMCKQMSKQYAAIETHPFPELWVLAVSKILHLQCEMSGNAAANVRGKLKERLFIWALVQMMIHVVGCEGAAIKKDRH
jgi:hypothetical protein